MSKVDYRKEDDTLIKSLCMQTFHKGLNEQYDRVLKVIKAYYDNKNLNMLDSKENEYYEYLKAIKKCAPNNSITYWLDKSFGKWPVFVEKNYLLESFVNDNMECIFYSKTNLSELNEIIITRGKVMMNTIFGYNVELADF